MILRYQLPRMIQRAMVTQALDYDVYDDAGAQQTASAGEVSIYAGSRLVVDAAAVTSLGPPASYSLLAVSVPLTESLSESWLEVVTLTIGGVVYNFRRPAYLVRHVLYPVITDTDLTDLHSDLLDLIDPSQSTYEAQRGAAWNRVNRWLIKKGNRPQLVLDSWALADLHTYLTLSAIFRDFSLSTGTGDRRYAELADHYEERAKAEQDTMVMRYDSDEDGTADEDVQRSATPVLYFSHPPEWR